jgi:hypothetical protein
MNMGLLTLREHLELSLEHLVTGFCKLAFLSAVRDPYTGRYLHEGWTMMGSKEEIHQLLRSRHLEIFDVVCDLSISQFCGELQYYLSRLPVPCDGTARLWSELEPYREMIPQGACAGEREFFVSQIRTALDVLVTAPEWVQREQSSSRFPQPDQQFQHHLEG